MILHEFEGVNIVNVLYAEDQHGPTENLHPVVFIGTLLSGFLHLFCQHLQHLQHNYVFSSKMSVF